MIRVRNFFAFFACNFDFAREKIEFEKLWSLWCLWASNRYSSQNKNENAFLDRIVKLNLNQKKCFCHNDIYKDEKIRKAIFKILMTLNSSKSEKKTIQINVSTFSKLSWHQNSCINVFFSRSIFKFRKHNKFLRQNNYVRISYHILSNMFFDLTSANNCIVSKKNVIIISCQMTSLKKWKKNEKKRISNIIESNHRFSFFFKNFSTTHSNNFHFQFFFQFDSIFEIVIVVVHQIFVLNFENKSWNLVFFSTSFWVFNDCFDRWLTIETNVVALEINSDVAIFTFRNDEKMFCSNDDRDSSNLLMIFINRFKFQCQLFHWNSKFESFISKTTKENRIHSTIFWFVEINKNFWFWFRNYRIHVQQRYLFCSIHHCWWHDAIRSKTTYFREYLFFFFEIMSTCSHVFWNEFENVWFAIKSKIKSILIFFRFTLIHIKST